MKGQKVQTGLLLCSFLVSVSMIALGLIGYLDNYTKERNLLARAQRVCYTCRPNEFSLDDSTVKPIRRVVKFKSYQPQSFDLTLDRGAYLTRTDVEAPFTLHNQRDIKTKEAILYFTDPD